MTTTTIRKVMFIAADQWRGECLSAAGHPLVRTPHLDALAAEGVLFRNHYCQASPCGPSRTSMLTGMYLMNHRSGRNGTPLDARHTNLALEVRKGGYDPTLFGYTDTSVDPRRYPPDDPALKTYEGPMPGYRIGMIFDDYMNAWMNDLRHKGYDFKGREDVFKPRDVALPAGRGPSQPLRPFIPSKHFVTKWLRSAAWILPALCGYRATNCRPDGAIAPMFARG